jgi:hypothetical protein
MCRRKQPRLARNSTRFTFPASVKAAAVHLRFLAPKSSGKMVVIGLSLVTIQSKASIETQQLLKPESTQYLYLHGLGVKRPRRFVFHHKLVREKRLRRRLAAHSRSVSPEIPRLTLQLRVSGVPEPGRSDEAVCTTASRRERRRAPDYRVPARA